MTATDPRRRRGVQLLTLMKSASPLFKSYYSDVEKAVEENPLQMAFISSNTPKTAVPLILGQLPILPKHWWETRDFNKGNLEIPVGSGPYTITEIKPGRSIRYERNKDYWGKDLPISKTSPSAQTPSPSIISAALFQHAFEALKADQFDYWLEILYQKLGRCLQRACGQTGSPD